MSEDEFDAWMETLPPPPGLPCTDEEIEAAEARAMQDYHEGRSYPHEIVSRWLMTWGTPGRKSFFEWLADQDG